jgi:hypothetical protein
MGTLISFPGVSPPETEPDKPFEEWRDEQIADLRVLADNLGDADDLDEFDELAEPIIDFIEGWARE